MGWIVPLLIAILLLVVLWLFFNWQVFGNNKSRYDFAHGIRSMLVLRENGGFLDIRHRRSRRLIRIYREGGGDDDAQVFLRVEVGTSTDSSGEALVSILQRQGYEAAISSAPDPTIAIAVRISDIWPAHSTASVARAAHLVLDWWGLGPDERFDLRIHGLSSKRGLLRLRAGKEIA